MNKQRNALWYALIVSAGVLILLFFGVWNVANLPAHPLVLDDECTDGDENLDYSCGNGAGYGDIPFPQCYSECDTLTQNVVVGDGSIRFRGVNLAGGEFEDDDAEHLARNGVFLPFDNDAELFVYKGMNTFRIPVVWEYMDLKGVSNYMTKLDSVIRDLTAKQYDVILDLHNYMRFNPGNVINDVINTNPDGDDVIDIGVGSDPLNSPFRELWEDLVRRYRSPFMIFGLMNEPHDVSFERLNLIIDAGLKGMRSRGPLISQRILIPGNNWDRLRSWFDRVNGRISNAENFAANWPRWRDQDGNVMLEIHHYFDEDDSGRYANRSECMDETLFKTQFDVYWPRFKQWCITNRVPVFVSAFGAPDTIRCSSLITHFLNALHNFTFTKSNGYGVVGWTAWAAGHGWPSAYPLSLAPSGRANEMMWRQHPYQQFLTPIATPIPPIETKVPAMFIRNWGRQKLLFKSGYVPFQFRGLMDIAPQDSRFLYSNNESNTPIDGLFLKYYTVQPSVYVIFGIDPLGHDGRATPYAVNDIPTIFVTNYSRRSQCFISPPGAGNNPLEARCFIVVDSRPFG